MHQEDRTTPVTALVDREAAVYPSGVSDEQITVPLTVARQETTDDNDSGAKGDDGSSYGDGGHDTHGVDEKETLVIADFVHEGRLGISFDVWIVDHGIQGK